MDTTLAAVRRMLRVRWARDTDRTVSFSLNVIGVGESGKRREALTCVGMPDARSKGKRWSPSKMQVVFP